MDCSEAVTFRMFQGYVDSYDACRTVLQHSTAGCKADLRKSLWPLDTAASGVSFLVVELDSETVNCTLTLFRIFGVAYYQRACCCCIKVIVVAKPYDHMPNEDFNAKRWLAACNSLFAVIIYCNVKDTLMTNA